MRWLGRAGIACAVLLAVCASAQAAPLEAYGQLPSLDNLVLSPDSTRLAFAATVDGQRVIAVRSLSDGAMIAGLKLGDQKLRDLSWASNDVLVFTTSQTIMALGVSGPRQEYYLAQAFNVVTHQSKGLLSNVDNAMNVVEDTPRGRVIDGHTVLFAEGIDFVNNKGVPALYQIDLESGRTKLLQQGNDNTRHWFIDEHGTVFARTEYNEDTRRWRLLLQHDGSWREVFGMEAPIERPSVAGIGPDGQSLVLLIQDNGVLAQKRIALADGGALAPIDLGDDFDSVVTDPVGGRIIGTAQLGTTLTYRFFDEADQKYWDSLTRAFPGENVELVSWSDDRRHVVARVDGLKSGAAYFIVDLNTHRAAQLGDVYGAVAPADVAEVKLISYAAADGREIPAYLTLPAGKPAKGLPLIVLPHGGPASRDTPQFDWWSQALASRGYAVLQPEFRGSDGFGWAHLAAGFGEWGRKMQTDLSDGVRFLTKQGMIDPKRVCIVGASYGGYAALAGATLDPGVYRCAVSVSGVSDPHDFLRWQSRRAPANDTATRRWWTRFMGVTDIDDPKLAEISPQSHAADAGIPILLIHGKDDTVVPISQSEDMARALERAGKSVSFVKLDGEDHWLSRPETRLRMLEETVQFLEANDPPG